MTKTINLTSTELSKENIIFNIQDKGYLAYLIIDITKISPSDEIVEVINNFHINNINLGGLRIIKSSSGSIERKYRINSYINGAFCFVEENENYPSSILENCMRFDGSLIIYNSRTSSTSNFYTPIPLYFENNLKLACTVKDVDGTPNFNNINIQYNLYYYTEVK